MPRWLWRICLSGIAAFLLADALPATTLADDGAVVGGVISGLTADNHQRQFDDCNAANDPARTIRGCGGVLARGSLITPSTRKIALISRASAYLAIGDFARALADADATLLLAPSEAPILSLRGQALAGLNRQDEAIQAFSQAIAANKNDVDDILRRAKSYAALSQSERATADFRTVVRLRFNQAQPYLEFGRYQFENGDYAAAIDLFQHAVANGPNNAAAYYWRGRAYEKAGEVGKATEDFAAATHLNPRQWAAWLACAMLAEKVGDTDRAHTCFVGAASGPDTDSDVIAAKAKLLPATVAVLPTEGKPPLPHDAARTDPIAPAPPIETVPIPPLVVRAHRL